MTDPRHRRLVDLRTLVERASSVGHLAGLLRREPGWEDAGNAKRSEAARRLSFLRWLRDTGQLPEEER